MTSIALTAALRTSHRAMPNIALAGDDQKNVIAYILSLESAELAPGGTWTAAAETALAGWGSWIRTKTATLVKTE